MNAQAASALAAACALAAAAPALGGTAGRRGPVHVPWTLHASIAATDRYAEIDLRSDGTYVEHGGDNRTDAVDCTGKGRLTAAMLDVVADAVHHVRARDWRSAYGVYAGNAAGEAVAVDAPVAVTTTAAPERRAVQQTFLRLSIARREYRTMVEFADGAYRNDAPPDLVRVVNALARPLTLCRHFDGSAPG